MKKTPLLILFFLLFFSCVANATQVIPIFKLDNGALFAVDVQENAAWKSAMSFYNSSDPTDELPVFQTGDEPGAWRIFSASSWDGFQASFGIHFQTYSPSGELYDWYSDPRLNSPEDQGIQHVFWNQPAPGIWSIHLEDLPSRWADWDRDDMVVAIGGLCGNLQLTEIPVDNPPAPVPEPATIILFGSGLASLSLIGRRKINK